MMPGQARWRHLRPFADSWRPATCRGRLWDTGRGYPAAIFGPGGEIPGVAVVLKRGVIEEAVRLLDEIEGEGQLHRRVEIATSAGPAVTYEWLGSTAGLLPLANGWPPEPEAG
ncbi:MAG: gamma-glutamylcyclotransferase family protein [Acidimicrobiia bacterium]